jgi:esterase/lipase superfamily enzyme
MHSSLSAGGVNHNYDLWGHDVSHDWPWWKKQMDHYIHRLF